MLDYVQMKWPGFYWLIDPNAQERVVVEVRGHPTGAQFVFFTGKSEPVKLEDFAGELVGPLRPDTFVTCT